MTTIPSTGSRNAEPQMRDIELESTIAAINRSQAVIEFDLNGTILDANENFLRIFDYQLQDVVGKHHRLFCNPSYAESDEYRKFWQRLGNGDYESGEFKRVNREGVEVWLQASYNPIFDEDGRPTAPARIMKRSRTRGTEEQGLRPLVLIWTAAISPPILVKVRVSAWSDVL